MLDCLCNDRILLWFSVLHVPGSFNRSSGLPDSLGADKVRESVCPLSHVHSLRFVQSFTNSFIYYGVLDNEDLTVTFIFPDVGLLTLNRYILLDPILLCFMMCATWGMTRVGSLRNEPFTKSWWAWLAFTGGSLACTISVKFVGLFVVLLVGLFTVYELWRELGDLSKPVVKINLEISA